MKVNLKNASGALVSTPIGFSWTFVFFGCLVPFFRGSLKWCAIVFLAEICTLGIAHIVFWFIFNKLYIKDLLKQGFTPADDYSKTILSQKGLYIS